MSDTTNEYLTSKKVCYHVCKCPDIVGMEAWVSRTKLRQETERQKLISSVEDFMGICDFHSHEQSCKISISLFPWHQVATEYGIQCFFQENNYT